MNFNCCTTITQAKKANHEDCYKEISTHIGKTGAIDMLVQKMDVEIVCHEAIKAKQYEILRFIYQCMKTDVDEIVKDFCFALTTGCNIEMVRWYLLKYHLPITTNLFVTAISNIEAVKEMYKINPTIDLTKAASVALKTNNQNVFEFLFENVEWKLNNLYTLLEYSVTSNTFEANSETIFSKIEMVKGVKPFDKRRAFNIIALGIEHNNRNVVMFMIDRNLGFDKNTQTPTDDLIKWTNGPRPLIKELSTNNAYFNHMLDLIKMIENEKF